MSDPEIPDNDWKRIRQEAESGKYGALSDLTRSGVIMLTRNLDLQKYRERWKTILSNLNPNYRPDPVPSDLLWKCEGIFSRIVEIFHSLKGKSLINNKRHNFLSYNYVQRKILEALGVLDYHNEFPVPRSFEKLGNLDDIMEVIMGEMKLPFNRSTIIKRPKIKKKSI